MYDLIVIGGGPAGASAAITAARGGASVLLLERGRFPKHKVCGEFVSAESLGLLSELLDPAHAWVLAGAPRLDRLRLFVDARVIRARIVPPAASVARFELDPILWDSAARAGVEARQQTTVQSITGGGPFAVSISGGRFESRAVINASGRWSNLGSSCGLTPTGAARYIGVKGHFAEPNPGSSVDLYFFEGGYCGVSAVALAGDGPPQRVNACALVRADVASSIGQVFELSAELRLRSRGWTPLSDPVAVSPLIFRHPEPASDGVLRCGDAAAFVDPFTGDGISIALRGGALAARCLLRFLGGECSLESATQAYETAYRQELAPVYHVSSQLRRLLASPRSLRAPILFALEKAPFLTEYLIRRTRAGA